MLRAVFSLSCKLHEYRSETILYYVTETDSVQLKEIRKKGSPNFEYKKETGNKDI